MTSSLYMDAADCSWIVYLPKSSSVLSLVSFPVLGWCVYIYFCPRLPLHLLLSIQPTFLFLPVRSWWWWLLVYLFILHLRGFNHAQVSIVLSIGLSQCERHFCLWSLPSQTRSGKGIMGRDRGNDLPQAKQQVTIQNRGMNRTLVLWCPLQHPIHRPCLT